MKRTLQNLLRREEGVSAIEYALIAALIAVAIIGALTALGLNVSGLFTSITSKLPALT